MQRQLLGLALLAYYETVQIAGSFTFAEENAGANKSVTASGMTISGADSANYYLSAITGAGTASITQFKLIFQVYLQKIKSLME